MINGKQVSGLADIGKFPPEALQRMEIYPEEKALRLGFAPNRRVINFVMLKKFRSLKANAHRRHHHPGRRGSREVCVTYSRIDDDRRINLGIGYKGADALLESQRDVQPPARPPYSFAGALIDSSGTLVGTGNGPDSDLASTRTLRGATDNLSLTAGLAGTVAGATVSLTTGLSASWNDSLQGPAMAALAIPAGNPFSTLGEDVTLYRYLGEARPLRQTGRSTTTSLGLSIDGSLGKWHWNTVARYDHTQSHSLIERGIDLRPLQAAILAGDPSIDPFGPCLPTVLGTRLVDRGSSTSDLATLNTLITGSLFKLPAGAAITNISLLGIANRADATSIQAGTTFRTAARAGYRDRPACA